MRDTEANEWDGVHITGYDTVLPLRNSISPPRETSIPSIKSTLMPSKPLKTHIADDCSRISPSSNFWYLESTVHDTDWMGDIARALVGRERQTYSGARERESISVRIVPLLLRCPNPSRQLAPYGHILRDKLSHSRSKMMMNIQARPLRVSAASEELHIAATRNINTIHQINSDALQTTQNSPR
mgnify:CR=1 FL=1